MSFVLWQVGVPKLVSFVVGNVSCFHFPTPQPLECHMLPATVAQSAYPTFHLSKGPSSTSKALQALGALFLPPRAWTQGLTLASQASVLPLIPHPSFSYFLHRVTLSFLASLEFTEQPKQALKLWSFWLKGLSHQIQLCLTDIFWKCFISLFPSFLIPVDWTRSQCTSDLNKSLSLARPRYCW